METILVGLKNEKTKQLLTDLALDLIVIKEQLMIEKTGKLSDLRHEIKSRMTEEQIDAQIDIMRNEWRRKI